MRGYVDPTEQLVTEILVRDIQRSMELYRRLGFQLLRDGGNFVELTWEEHRFFLALSARHSMMLSTSSCRPFHPFLWRMSG